jgi:hypothetical protein
MNETKGRSFDWVEGIMLLAYPEKTDRKTALWTAVADDRVSQIAAQRFALRPGG